MSEIYDNISDKKSQYIAGCGKVKEWDEVYWILMVAAILLYADWSGSLM